MRKILTTLSIVSLTYISAATLTTDKPTYATTDTVKVNFSEMDNHNKDWIAIYPKGSSTAWKNVVKWAWTENKSEGTLTFKNLPAGDYEVRGFYNNSYNAEATKTFKVEGNGAKAELSSTKPTFRVDEDVRINFKNINGATNDWMGIYPADSNNDWGNVIKWKFNKGGVKAGQANFGKLPKGKYEARIFYNNTFKMEGKVAFSVGEVNVDPIDPVDAKVLKIAKEHCLGKDDSTGKVLCSNEENIAYLIQEDDCTADTYKVNFKTETVEKFANVKKLCAADVNFYKLKNSKLIYISNYHFGAATERQLSFYTPNKKLVLSLSFRDDGFVHNTRLKSIKSIDNGNKMQEIYDQYTEEGEAGVGEGIVRKWIKHTVIYDISDINNIKHIAL